jgi:hypothetical protein
VKHTIIKTIKITLQHNRQAKYLGVLSEFFLEDSDRAWATNIMGHQNVNIHPHILTGTQLGFLGSPGQYLLGHRHRSLDLKLATIPPLKSTNLSNLLTKNTKIDERKKKKKKLIGTELSQWWKACVPIAAVP